MVGVDSLEGALRISQLAQLEQTSVEVRLEIDTGLQRTGVAEAEAIPIAKEISRMNGVDLTGIFTFRGPVLHGSPTRDIRSAGHDEGKVLAALARKLRDASVPIKEVSAGSTQTAIYAAEIDGITEVRPGTYIYHDRMQVEFGVCKIEDCAGAVFTTVVSRPAKDRIVVDAGSKAFATDVQPGQPPLYLSGFGHVIGDPTAIFERMNEEHGVITIHPDASYKVGDVIAIIPNHICSTVNLHNAMYIKEASGELRKMAIPARGMLD